MINSRAIVKPLLSLQRGKKIKNIRTRTSGFAVPAVEEVSWIVAIFSCDREPSFPPSYEVRRLQHFMKHGLIVDNSLKYYGCGVGMQY
jgi:hypothetical protein